MSRKSRERKEIIRHWRAAGYSMWKPTLASYRQERRFLQRFYKDAKRDRAKWKRIKIEWEEDED